MAGKGFSVDYLSTVWKLKNFVHQILRENRFEKFRASKIANFHRFLVSKSLQKTVHTEKFFNFHTVSRLNIEHLTW